ncbi:dihydrofolate reductase family protein [Glycomyces artemisiae]|uniref:Dihydrofolate reductase n=1 Tax=Glycomyces artemisiae TaxID=1076443 RepID=A0A2T0ULE2_9ACTN|nr:dihydrofolate reductase family protein [Glycomyces artemisiae]PRY58704.1 dihydrofolate reductase [Glycomyces artemisiae]
MRNVINSTYISLDGVIQEPQHWPATGGFGERGNRMQAALLERCDAVLMGRSTYESFASVWPGLAGNPMGDRMNALPKYVVSTTLKDPEWNNTNVIDRDPVTAVADLKRQPGGDIVQYGFGPLAHELMANGLLDELRLWIHPFILGTGTPADLLYRAGSSGGFALAEAITLDSGIVMLTYRTAK